MANNDVVSTSMTLTCPSCQTTMGKVVLVNGRVYVLFTDVMARVFIRHCPACGKRYHFDGRAEDVRVLAALTT